MNDIPTNDIDASLPDLRLLLEQRLALLRMLYGSLEFSTTALVENDVEVIARGAAHQAELCRQWSVLEDALRSGARAYSAVAHASVASADGEHSVRLKAEWKTVAARIRYLTRVHCSLLRHLQRSLAVLNRVVDSCAPTYAPDPTMIRTGARLSGCDYAAQAENCARDCAGE